MLILRWIRVSLDIACKFIYNAGMNSTQYTIRAVPFKLDQVLRKRAKKTGQSLNEVLVESLARGAGVNIDDHTYHDLDWFVGSQTLDESFDEAMAWLDSAPKDIV